MPGPALFRRIFGGHLGDQVGKELANLLDHLSGLGRKLGIGTATYLYRVAFDFDKLGGADVEGHADTAFGICRDRHVDRLAGAAQMQDHGCIFARSQIGDDIVRGSLCCGSRWR